MTKYVLPFLLLTLTGCEEPNAQKSTVHKITVSNIIVAEGYIQTINIEGTEYYCTYVHGGLAIGPERKTKNLNSPQGK